MPTPLSMWPCKRPGPAVLWLLTEIPMITHLLHDLTLPGTDACVKVCGIPCLYLIKQMEPFFFPLENSYFYAETFPDLFDGRMY